MKMATHNYTNDSYGMGQESSFQIKASAQAFQIIVSGIAKDKIGYPVREICTNAWDAARGDVDVTLPTWLDPTFKVRDFGTGVDHQFMMTRYATVFDSTKNDSNDSVGGMGIGRLSVFAYLTAGGKAGAFNVTSYQNATANFYLVGLAADGTPKVQHLATTSTDERDGLEVAFGVRREDFDKFQQATRKILWAFEPRPRVKNMTLGWVENFDVIRSGKGWQEFSRADVPFYAPHVRMGCVYYPISLQAVGRDSDWPWHSQSILFEAEIGSLSVTASREDLSYDDRTIATVKACIDRFEEEFCSNLQTRLDAASTLVDALSILYHDPSLNGSSGLRGYLVKRLTWKGGPIRTNHTWNRKTLGKNTFIYDTACSELFEQDGGRKEDSVFNLYNMLLDHTPPKFAIERKRNFSGLKFKAAEAAGLIAHGDRIVWLRPDSDQTITQVANFLRIVPDDFIDLDAMLPKQKRGKRDASTPIYLNLHTLSAGGMTESVTTDITKPGVYVARSENKVKHGYGRTYAFDMYGVGINNTNEWTNTLKNFVGKIDLPPIALAPHGQAERLKKLGWKKFTTEDLVAAMEKTIDFTTILDSVFTVGRRMEHALTGVNLFPQLFPADIVDLAIKHHMMKVALNSPDQSNTTRYNLYKAHGGTKTPNSVSTVNSETEIALAAVTTRYPVFNDMMEIIADHANYQGVPNEEHLKAVARYLSMFAAQIEA